MASGLVALVLALSAHRRMSSTRRALVLLQGEHAGKDLLAAVAAYTADVKGLTARLSQLSRRQDRLFELLGQSTRNLGVVRYDAFEEMGGKVSFSAALLDDSGNGVVITSINGRAESRTYAKKLESGDSDHNLSREEGEAIQEALGRTARV